MRIHGSPKDCRIANYILTDGRKLPNCPGSLMGACDDCGFSMAGEMYSVLRMKPDTILAGMQLRMQCCFGCKKPVQHLNNMAYFCRVPKAHR